MKEAAGEHPPLRSVSKYVSLLINVSVCRLAVLPADLPADLLVCRLAVLPAVLLITL